jgi:hypothetical protein
MKKLLAIVVLCCVLFSVVSSSAEQIDADNVLVRVGTIVKIDEENDVVVVMDTVGMLWEFEGIEDYMLDDTVALLMDRNNTETIFDDIILRVFYVD